MRLIEPRADKQYAQTLRANAEVEVPEGGVSSGSSSTSTRRWSRRSTSRRSRQAIVLPAPSAVAYVRAVAYQPDGNSTEDLVFINAPDYLEEIEVQFVELYTTVLDQAGRPVLDLGEKDFSVFEDGVQQEIARFEQVRDLPIHAGVVLDVSASMEPSIDAAKQAALQFFESAITPKDRAALITFNDRPQLAAKFTNELTELAGGLAGLKAERGTALYDSLIFTLYYFNGVKGQRALLLLSDGKDESSNFTFEDALDYARRAGVTIYTIGLWRKDAERPRRRSPQIAEETGGRSFFLETADELDRHLPAPSRRSCARATCSPTSPPTPPQPRRSARSRCAWPGPGSRSRRCGGTTPRRAIARSPAIRPWCLLWTVSFTRTLIR